MNKEAKKVKEFMEDLINLKERTARDDWKGWYTFMKRPKILFYCGEPFYSEIFIKELPEFEWEIVAGFFGEENIDTSRERIANEDYDLFITSNTGMGAYTALKQICLLPEKRKFKAIYISGYVDQKIVDTCKAKDVVLIPMPFEFEEFKSHIRHSVQERR